MEEAALKQRLYNDERVFKKLVKKSIFNLVDSHDLDLDIMTLELNIERMGRFLETAKKDEDFYADEIEKLNIWRQSFELEVTKLKETLDLERNDRKKKDRYDEIAKEINKMSSKEALNTSLAELHSNCEESIAEQENIQKFIEDRAIQVRECINRLKHISLETASEISKCSL